MDFFQIDVFADAPYQGNPLAVFIDASALTGAQMQSIAREMNLSETIFVTGISGTRYDVRIFTPHDELPFAGHPTVGCAWLLAELGLVPGDEVTQRSAAGDTPLRRIGTDFWFDRRGSVAPFDIDVSGVAAALGLRPEDVGLDWDGTYLGPAIADAGIPQLMLPVRGSAELQRAVVPQPFEDSRHAGVYCFTRADGGIRARGMFPDVGVPEDPATGSAAAGLGLYLGDALGGIETIIKQGIEIGRPSTIRMRSEPGRVSIGGSCRRVLKGTLEALP